jgi:hypothetical protein
MVDTIDLESEEQFGEEKSWFKVGRGGGEVEKIEGEILTATTTQEALDRREQGNRG